MSKYIVMVKTGDVVPSKCEGCKLIYQIDEGREIKCYKELELEVVVKNDMENN